MFTKILVVFLIFFFLLLIVLPFVNPSREGMDNIAGMNSFGAGALVGSSGTASGSTYVPYDLNNPNNALILGQQNAGNINYLKGRIDDLMKLQSEVSDISGNVIILNQQVQGLVQQQAGLVQNVVGSTPPKITGT